MEPINVLITINGALLISFLGVGYRVIRFISRIEFKTEVLWKDYETRLETKTQILSDWNDEERRRAERRSGM